MGFYQINAFSEEERILYVGAMYHDIGKFFQRSFNKNYEKIIKQKYITVIGDERRDYLKHQEWSAYFLDEFLKDSSAGTLVLKHHRPENFLQYLVAVADKLAAAEREKTGAEERFKPKTEPLVAILSQIELNGQKGEPAYKKLSPRSTENLSDAMPTHTKEDALDKTSYEKMWFRFLTELKDVDFQSQEHKLWVLTSLMNKYTANIPSAVYYARPSISLWLHSKLTTAIAFALYRQGLNEAKAKAINQALIDKHFHGKQSPFLEEVHFCLVKGDLSGIQDFVYDVAMDGAVRALRARSFYISYLMEVIARYILRSECLPVTNILYAGGGHFYLLLPAKSLQRLDEYRLYCDEVLYAAHRGKIAVLLEAVALKLDDFGDENFADRWLEVGLKIQEQKGKKFWQLIQQERNDSIFGPFPDAQEVCPHCLRQTHDGKCGFCSSFLELGEQLAKASNLNEMVLPLDGRGAEDVQSVKDVFRVFGFDYTLSAKPEAGPPFALKEDDLNRKKHLGVARIAGYFPVLENGNLKDFDRLADEAQGLKTWGVLRGDVDNLGRIFGEGLGENRSITRVAALSEDFSFYFTGLLPKIVGTSNFKEQAGIIYSGGDDFFIVGSWDVLPLIAQLINDEFKKFAARNPAISVSMGIKLAQDKKYPLYRVALDAGEELDNVAKENVRILNAKENQWSQNGLQKEKDSLAFLSTAIGWDEFSGVEGLQKLIIQAIHKGAPHSLLQILYKSVAEKKSSQEHGEIFKVWRILYYLNRLKKRVKKETGEELTRIQHQVLRDGNRLYQFTTQSVRWADLLLRETGGK